MWRIATWAMLSIVTLMAVASSAMSTILPLLPPRLGIVALCTAILLLCVLSLALTLRAHRLQASET